MANSIRDVLQDARSYESPKHSESELRDYLIGRGADYYDASQVARDTLRNIEVSSWDDGSYREE